jgi:hypothetical protein
MSPYFTPSIVSEVTCLCFAFFYLLNDKVKVWKWIVMFLLVTCLTEIGGLYLIRSGLTNNNNWIYNIYLPIEIIYLHWMYAYLFKEFIRSHTNFVSFGFFILVLVYCIDIYLHSFLAYANLTFTIFSVIIVLYGLFYFYLLFNAEQYVELTFSSEFWWVAGTIFFYFGATICNIFNEYYPRSFYVIAYYIFGLLNVILYGCWTYSFYCRRRLLKI